MTGNQSPDQPIRLQPAPDERMLSHQTHYFKLWPAFKRIRYLLYTCSVLRTMQSSEVTPRLCMSWPGQEDKLLHKTRSSMTVCNSVLGHL